MSDVIDPLHPIALPEKPALEGLETKWNARWEAEGTHRFDRSRPRDDVYSIDTPPPTVSGSLHVGHVFSFTHTDVIARFQRMRGKAVFYPMGWDDNGLPTERRVQNFYGVRCDPSLAVRPRVHAAGEAGEAGVAVSRPNFIELCNRLTVEDEKAFEQLWRHLGLSVDWSMTYATIDRRAQRVSQASFLRLLNRGIAYQLEAPTLWDVDFRTAVAQAELEDREQPGAYHRIRFARHDHSPAADGQRAFVEIETTRPELIPACVALVAHPDDERYRPLFGTQVVTPLFGVAVPVRPHHLADPEKGSGIAMICTFGDLTDVTWWRELSLPVRAVIQPNGTLRPIAWGTAGWESTDAPRAQGAYDQLTNLPASKARVRIVEMLRESSDLVAEPRPITHPVKFYEKGDRPLEIITSRQWFIKTTEYREELLARGRELRWHPDYMRHRYENWVNGLAGDWCISRQRFFGVPFPVWYPVRADGSVDYSSPLLPGRVAAADRSLHRCSRRLHGRSARSTERVLGGSRHHGHVGDVLDVTRRSWRGGSTTRICSLAYFQWTCGRRPTTSSEPGFSIRSCGLTSSTARCRGPMRPSRVGSWTRTARRCRNPRATSSRRWDCWRSMGPTACATGRSALARGPIRRSNPAQMKVGRRLSIKILNAARFALGSAEPRGPIVRAARSWHADEPVLAGRRLDTAPRGVRLRAGAWIRRRNSSGAFVTSTWSW